jgi:BlaI family transcriptional regulator, penicillinase repressor
MGHCNAAAILRRRIAPEGSHHPSRRSELQKSFSGCLTCRREIATMKPNLNNQITLKALANKQNRRADMARPPAKELTERELEVMHVVWKLGEATATEVRDELALGGLDRAYTTVATLVRILLDKGFLDQRPGDRPFRYRPARSYEEVSRRLLGDLVERVFSGSREQLLMRLLEQKKLTAKERAALEAILKENPR